VSSGVYLVLAASVSANGPKEAFLVSTPADGDGAQSLFEGRSGNAGRSGIRIVLMNGRPALLSSRAVNLRLTVIAAG
jgi:hypothetical protein